MLQNFKVLFLKVYIYFKYPSIPSVFSLGRTNKNRLDIHISIEKVFELPATSTEVWPLFRTPPHQVLYHLEQLIDDLGMLWLDLVERTVPNFGPYVCLGPAVLFKPSAV